MRTLCPAPGGKDPAALRRWLEERLDEIGRSAASKPRENAIPTGWPEVDASLGGGLRTGGAHEWHAPAPAPGSAPAPVSDNDIRHRAWTPPLTILAHLALAGARAMTPDDGAPGWIAWIGRRVWPYAPALARMGGHTALRRSLLIDPDSEATRLWALDLALRCPSLVVVADGSGLALAETRRVQLAAEAGGSIALLARPRWERGVRSAALTRWEVNAAQAEVLAGGAQRWEIVLSARKGARPTSNNAGRWIVERSVDGAIRVVPVLGVRRREAALAS